ncbi:hypothetical protein [Magnetospirillum fulvum]|jgi:hypothetical protein|uniref:Lipoprotein n=1 Tax=Magnetospirillum fulvum MGU-K5 TaxID=1316936 RepID=S9TIY7_MAGFU|nr:hypothetical protein [Magnetospirillum fulvum]EPY02176.1 hypothetical protein K678_07353 [Magnetospirillum fulvum MGU-K5]
MRDTSFRLLASAAMLVTVAACETNNVQEFKQHGPAYTLSSKMKYDRIGECLWQTRSRDMSFPGTMFRNENVRSQVFRISYVKNISLTSELLFVIETSPSPQNPDNSLVTVYTMHSLFGMQWPQSWVQEDIDRCETYSN